MTNNIEDWRNLVLYVFRNKYMLFSDKINKTKEVTTMNILVGGILILLGAYILFGSKGGDN